MAWEENLPEQYLVINASMPYAQSKKSTVTLENREARDGQTDGRQDGVQRLMQLPSEGGPHYDRILAYVHVNSVNVQTEGLPITVPVNTWQYWPMQQWSGTDSSPQLLFYTDKNEIRRQIYHLAFSVAGPSCMEQSISSSLWSRHLYSFKRKLKTHLQLLYVSMTDCTNFCRPNALLSRSGAEQGGYNNRLLYFTAVRSYFKPCFFCRRTNSLEFTGRWFEWPSCWLGTSSARLKIYNTIWSLQRSYKYKLRLWATHIVIVPEALRYHALQIDIYLNTYLPIYSVSSAR